MTQARQFPRYALEAALTVQVDGRAIEGRTSNLSRGGLCAMMGEAVPVGVRVDVQLALVFDNDSFSEPLSLRARTVWCTPIGSSYQVGLAFVGLGAENGRYLDVFLRFLQGEE